MLTDAKDRAAGNNILVQKAGGIGGRYKLVLKYTARKGQQKDAVSKDPRYQKTWATAEEITDADRAAFREWVETKMSRGGGASLKRARSGSPAALPSRSSARLDSLEAACSSSEPFFSRPAASVEAPAAATDVPDHLQEIDDGLAAPLADAAAAAAAAKTAATTAALQQVHPAVRRCVEFLVARVVRDARLIRLEPAPGGPARRSVRPKRAQRAAPATARARPPIARRHRTQWSRRSHTFLRFLNILAIRCRFLGGTWILGPRLRSVYEPGSTWFNA